MCNPKDELVRVIRTVFGIGTIRKRVVSELEVEVKLNHHIIKSNYEFEWKVIKTEYKQ